MKQDILAAIVNAETKGLLREKKDYLPLCLYFLLLIPLAVLDLIVITFWSTVAICIYCLYLLMLLLIPGVCYKGKKNLANKFYRTFHRIG